MTIIPPKKKNILIPSLQLDDKKGDLDIYLYHKVEFSNSEKINSIIFMMVVQTDYFNNSIVL